MSQKDRRSDWIIFALRTFAIAAFIVSAWLLFGDSSTSGRTDQRGPAVTPAGSQASPGYTTKPIEAIRVGDRVYAHNPEVDDAERSTWTEPDWKDWLHLSLVMPKEDGSELKIELLRPESWVLEQVSYIAQEREPAATELVATSTGSRNALTDVPAETVSGKALIASNTTDHVAPTNRQLSSRRSQESQAPELVPLSPLRPFYRQVAITSALLEAAESELVGLTVEMDLPEMGASGTAVIVNVAACPPVRSGEGQPVTATFTHPPSTAVLNVAFEGQSDPIGVTDNHLFWSVDRQQFLPIGEMEIGETVQTFHGNTKRIEAKLPRPGPEVVYNLEVYGEHVYFVGEQGLLAHNQYVVKIGKKDGRIRVFEGKKEVVSGKNLYDLETKALTKAVTKGDIDLPALRAAIDQSSLRGNVGLLASEMAIIKPGQPAWDEAIKSLRAMKRSHGNDFSVGSRSHADELVDSSFGKIPELRAHSEKVFPSFQIHLPELHPPRNNLPHIKFYFEGIDGHIYYRPQS